MIAVRVLHGVPMVFSDVRVRANVARQYLLAPRPRDLHRAHAIAEPEAIPPAATKKAASAGKGVASSVPHWQTVVEELEKKEGRKTLVISIAPAVRVAMSEPFGLAPGTISTGKLVAGLHKLGFDHVFDITFSADLTIMEEAAELLHRLQEHLDGHPSADEPMPMFTSCCPGWVAMVEKSYPEIIPYLSTCKSPQMMMGAVIKNFFAQEKGIPSSEIVSCTIMPCLRKQGEADRPDGSTAEGGGRDIDHVVTTLEMATIFQGRGIDLMSLTEEPFDTPLGLGSSAGLLFGTTGGVMEAALRTVSELVTGEMMGRILFEEVRGLEGIKAATLTLKPAGDWAKYNKDDKGLEIRIAVANGLGNAKKLITEMKAGTAKYDFIEVMACPSGCIGGGGQPRSTDKQTPLKRQQAMYALDGNSVLRRCHENPMIQALYKKFLGSPNGHKAHELLHTHYFAGGPEGQG